MSVTSERSGDLEAGLLGRDEVAADGKQRDDVVALLVGRRDARQAGVLVRDRDLDLPHHGTARILHGSGDLPGGSLGGRNATRPASRADDDSAE